MADRDNQHWLLQHGFLLVQTGALAVGLGYWLIAGHTKTDATAEAVNDLKVEMRTRLTSIEGKMEIVTRHDERISELSAKVIANQTITANTNSHMVEMENTLTELSQRIPLKR